MNDFFSGLKDVGTSSASRFTSQVRRCLGCIGVGAIYVALWGCSTIHTQPVQPVSQNPAVVELHEYGRALHSSGQYTQARNTLERALRLEPQNARLWLDLARLSQDAGSSAEARALAVRAQTFAGTDTQLARDIERFLAAL